jgi:predicted membrane channel-forming protein YqfA (hemolysin III family)
MPSTVQTLYYPRPRSTLLILSLCLGVCSIFIPLSFRNTIIIISGFLLIVITAVAVMAMQFGHYSRDLLFVATLVVLIGAAVFFPFLGHWNPKDIFDKHMEGISDA